SRLPPAGRRGPRRSGVLVRLRPRRAARPDVQELRAPTDAAAADVPALPLARVPLGPDVGTGHDLVLHRAAPAAPARVPGARAIQRDRGRTRGGPGPAVRRQ